MTTKLAIALLAVAIALIPDRTARAQATDTAQLGTVVVSASKVPKPASSLTQPVTVLLGEDLRARGVTRVTDALREVPGATLVQSGSYGALTSLFLRGGESRYTKVLIDGVPVNAAGGSFDFSHLTTDNIDRIEIVRGPASVLYGADAVSGIVQIFTRKGSGDTRASLAARAGTYHSLDLVADVAGSTALGGFSLGAAQHSTDGILPFNNEYRNGTLSTALALAESAAGDARISARYTAAEFHYPTDFAGQPVDSNSYRTQHRLTVGLDAGRNLASNVQVRLLAGSNDVSDLTEDIAIPFGGTTPEKSAFRSRGYRRSAEGRVAFFLPTAATLTVGSTDVSDLTEDIAIPFGGTTPEKSAFRSRGYRRSAEGRVAFFLATAATLTVGSTYEREHENSSNEAGAVGGPAVETDSFDASRHTIAYYSELLGNLTERFSYTVSGRLDDNSDYDQFRTYRLGANAGLFPGVRLRASLSTAFNAPAFNQLRPTLYTVGSPELRPERIRSAEIGLVASVRRELIQLSASYFAQRFSDLIQYVSGGPPDFKGSYANLTAATSNGYEAELQLSPVRNWRGSASFTIVNPRVAQVDPAYQGGSQVGDALLRRPSHSGSAVLSYARPSSASFGASVNFVGKRPDVDFAQFPSPRVTLPGYTRLDLSAELPLTRTERRGFTLSVRLENVFDKRYAEVLRFLAPGRTVLIGARATRLF